MLVFNSEEVVRVATPVTELQGILIHKKQSRNLDIENYDFRVSQYHLSRKFVESFLCASDAYYVAENAIEYVQGRYRHCAEKRQTFWYISEDGKQEMFYIINDRNLIATCVLAEEITTEECFIDDYEKGDF